jgi:glutamyl-tRNA synthetase/glutamyl-Q tRNA(Asp) synthetase
MPPTAASTIRTQLGPEAAVTRFAPSPTGYLHLGHVAHMIYVWGVAAAVGGKVLLRIEDHDRGRCRREYEQAIIEDMEWLGFEPHNQVDGLSPYRQSDSEAVYGAALARLQELHEVYRCTCSRKDIAEHSVPGEGGERRYNGRCRGQERRADVPHGMRAVMEAGEERFVDAYLGEQAQDPARQCGDLLLRDRHGQWTYQFAVTVDDMRHGVNLVVRGEDLLASTGRQIRLARMLGRKNPVVFAHHPLITDQRGEKLSKKQAAPAVRELRAQGMPSEHVLGRAAFEGGLIAEQRPLGRDAATGLVMA